MLIKRIRTKTRPSTNISYIHDYGGQDESEVYRDSCIENGIIHSRVLESSEDDLSLVEEIQFTSIENCINYEKTINDLEYNNGSLLTSLQYMLDNGITHAVSYVFEH